MLNVIRADRLKLDMLPQALDRAQATVEAGRTAPTTITIDVGDGPFTMVIPPERIDIGAAFHQAREIMVYKGARSFLVTGQTDHPETIYIALIKHRSGAGLCRAITREPHLSFGPNTRLPIQTIAPLMAFAPKMREELPRPFRQQARGALEPHKHQEPGTPLVLHY